MIVMNANLNLVVESPADVMDTVAKLAADYGGFVVTSDLGQTQGQYGTLLPHATITIRVPANKLNQALDEVEGLADKVVSKNQSGQDVTADYTDLQSRLRNLERAEEQLSQVMADANRTEDVLLVYNELTQVTEQIEVIKGQMQYFEEASAFSAISLTLNAIEVPPATPPKAKWQPSEAVRRALADLKVRAQFWADQAIRFTLYQLPLMILALWPYALAGWLLYRWIGRKWFKPKAQEPAAAD
jgi:hypothetical protein